MADITVHIAEFGKLKDEQIERISQRERLRHQTMLLLGGGLGLAVQNSRAQFVFVFIIPIVAFISGVSHIACDRRIAEIARYVREQLAPEISRLTSEPVKELFMWETVVRHDPRRYMRRWLEIISNMILYVGSGIAAPFIYYWSVIRERHPAVPNDTEKAVFIFVIVLMLIMAWQLWVHSRVRIDAGKEAASTSKSRVLRRLAASVVFALLAAWAVFYFGPHMIPDPQGIVPTFGFAVQVTRLNASALAAAVLAWSIGLLSVGR